MEWISPLRFIDDDMKEGRNPMLERGVSTTSDLMV